jgi:response regulator RpfG family c-di-GMP phosphodiesterase
MGARILIVDDEALIRDLFREWLGLAGHTCLEAGSAEEALEVLAGATADVALLDLRMPGEDGVWLARQLRERQHDMAIIMATGAQSFEAAVQGMRLGVLDYLIKPFSRQQLMAAISSALSVREQSARDRKERERLEQEVEERSAALCDAFVKIREASAGTLEALLVTLHTRNPEAFDHTKRVADMATTLATAMGLHDPLLSQIECAALLHDIGKVAMPDSLIHKPGKLSEEELRIIRTHPQIGHDILAAVPSLQPAADVVLASHEWYDGHGYPRGLKGEEIPIGARIVTVADAYDALTRPRVYRPAVSAQAATAELARCAGHQFDPAVVRAWLGLSGLSFGPSARPMAAAWQRPSGPAAIAAHS